MARREKIAPATGAEPAPGTERIHRAGMKDCELPNFYEQPSNCPARVAEPDDLVLEHLKRIQAELSAARERDEALLARMVAFETAMLSVKREVLTGEETDARLQAAVDGILRRIDRIERRLELAG